MQKDKILVGLIIIINIVGALGTIYAPTRSLFIALTPLNLVLNAALLIYTDRNKVTRIWTFLAFCWLVGFGAELIGVHTGFLFGSYAYGASLGPQLLDVPLTIGVNWFILSYSFAQIGRRVAKPLLVSALISAALMTGLDFIIEPVAISLDYWSWESGMIPLTNYLGWFGVSLIIQLSDRTFFRLSKLNRLAIPVLVGMTGYFVIILIFL